MYIFIVEYLVLKITNISVKFNNNQTVKAMIKLKGHYHNTLYDGED